MCFWANHKILNEIKCKNCHGCEKIFPDHTCLFDNNEDWIERFYDEIISKLDVGLIYHIFYKLSHTSPHTSIFVELNKVDV